MLWSSSLKIKIARIFFIVHPSCLIEYGFYLPILKGDSVMLCIIGVQIQNGALNTIDFHFYTDR